METWENLRENYNNGNITDTIKAFKTMPRPTLLRVISEALEQMLEYEYPNGHHKCGNIIDLTKILQKTRRA